MHYVQLFLKDYVDAIILVLVSYNVFLSHTHYLIYRSLLLLQNILLGESCFASFIIYILLHELVFEFI